MAVDTTQSKTFPLVHHAVFNSLLLSIRKHTNKLEYELEYANPLAVAKTNGLKNLILSCECGTRVENNGS